MNESKQHLPIGVFDSGVGGLTVLRQLLRLLPDEEYRYLGDTARLPYGTKSSESVIRYALQSSKHLVEQGVKLLVVACNTASSVALPALEEAYPGLPVVGVVRPGARAGCSLNTNGRMAVIATEATVRGGAYQRAVLELCPVMHVEAQACGLFVALAEEGWTSGELVEAVVRKSLTPLFERFGEQQPDCLVLGCTHFPVLAGAIEAVVGPEVAVIDSAVTTAQEVRDELRARGLLRPAGEVDDPARVRFWATDGAERFARVGSIFLGCDLAPEDVELVDL
ncbi:MAG: glutamate racemase [Proteobacteria bacterium]|nr:glutamate racemase [Pseudomonadota bacterium]